EPSAVSPAPAGRAGRRAGNRRGGRGQPCLPGGLCDVLPRAAADPLGWRGAMGRCSGGPAGRPGRGGQLRVHLLAGRGAASAYSDLPLGCLIGAALVLLLRSRRSVAGAVTAGLFLAGAVLSKNEGTLLALFLPLTMAPMAPLLIRRRDRARQAARLLAALAPPLLALAF